MEKKRLVVKKEDRDLYVELNKIFMWNLDEENNLNERKILLNFSRDESVPHLNEIKVVEMDYSCLLSIHFDDSSFIHLHFQ